MLLVVLTGCDLLGGAPHASTPTPTPTPMPTPTQSSEMLPEEELSEVESSLAESSEIETSELEASEMDSSVIETSSSSSSEEVSQSEPAQELIDYRTVGEYFELPVQGATGYASIALKLRNEADFSAPSSRTIEAGGKFVLLEEADSFLKVEYEGNVGWISKLYAMINLPDVIPSIVYRNTNAKSSVFHSSSERIPGLTGEKLYDSLAYNERLGYEEYTMPVLFDVAKKIDEAQKNALEQGDTLILYEAYRPYAVQRKVVSRVQALADKNEKVMDGITKAPWSISWFISTGVSNHQVGYAIDVSLGRVLRRETVTIANFVVDDVKESKEYKMPTPIHELSTASASLVKPVASRSKTAWKNVKVAASMNEAALNLRRYCTDAGLTPLASEWWHFNDLDVYAALGKSGGTGTFVLSGNVSRLP